ncbi:Zinc carboxypeptidase [Formosa sp. Hel1_31_208]|uniref:M14 family zinc carboxypeptidase n=1 Tax=Formosa sp. Hel1_31_208 TaxID=1798225 RepID=UPI000879B4C1|nr:M14 family zinc carboxypeptidase [Formosa sp. Hel1_31_208]SDS43227.1 Zinc carboxypeptidase [Formosa sp. Hel1_31_208]
MQIDTLKYLFNLYKETALYGRYISHKTIAPLLEKLGNKVEVARIGKSVNGLPIYALTFGVGEKKILMWSQMHGNESTTTKAIFDVLNVICSDEAIAKLIRQNCKVTIIPILNPDGAEAYARLNANGIDLNRDAQNLSQPESKVLKSVFEDVKPHFCFNLHGQRTIFSAGHTEFPATVSFLAPAQDHARSVTQTRSVAMEIITKMNDVLQQQIPNQVGVYDDSFNLNCVGDMFQALHVPTVLFEAGHYHEDYLREQTREYICQSLLVALDYIAQHTIDGTQSHSYAEIPKNEKRFYDIIIKNTDNKDIAIQYQETLIDGVIEFVPKVEKISNLDAYVAHKVLDAGGYRVLGRNNNTIKEGSEIDFVMINNEKFVLKW